MLLEHHMSPILDLFVTSNIRHSPVWFQIHPACLEWWLLFSIENSMCVCFHVHVFTNVLCNQKDPMSHSIKKLHVQNGCGAHTNLHT